MIDAKRFELIRRKHGSYGSWAVWAPEGGKPKSNMGDIRILDPRANTDLLRTLNPGVVMLGLNFSRGFPDRPFGNFHDPDSAANDFKIRYAFRGTSYWGAYMTDVIKGYSEPVSGKLVEHLRAHPEVVERHIQTLRSELLDLDHPRPVMLAFGGVTYSLLKRYLSGDEYSLLVQLTHYSHYISKEKYRAAVHEQIASAQRIAAQQVHSADGGR